MKSGLHSEQFYREMWETIVEGKVWHGQFANRRKDGTIYWAASTIVPWLDDSGLPYQYIAIRTDITDQKAIAHALEDARRRELEIGTSIQRSLLKDEVPDGIQGAWLASFTEPSQGIDGDFYAIRQFHSDCFEILVGDVMGKGVPAALIGAAIKTSYNQVLADLLVEHAGEGTLPTPAAIVNRLHRALTPRLVDLASFATLALYRFDLPAGTLTYVNAGHTPGLLTRALDARPAQIMGDNLPIGVMAQEEYVQFTVAIEPGDSLLVFSDGITEARDAAGEEFGLERLSGLIEAGRKATLPPATLLHAIRQELRRFTRSDELLDDQTALMVELHPRRRLPRGAIAQRVNPYLFNLGWNFDALQTLRARIEESAWFLPAEDANALILASFEAATNILRHAPPLVADATLCCRVTRRENALIVELIYPSEAFIPPAPTQPDFSGNSEGGFGLYIIANSVDAIDYDELMPGIGSIRLLKRAGAAPKLH
jgi:anti-sigma regulatory factor (Ser/Thr protein kinase)